MRTTLGRNINLCFTNIRIPGTTESASSSSTPQDHHRPFPNSTTASILIKNFNSLYDHTSKSLIYHSDYNDDVVSSSSDSDAEAATTPDLATVFASQRFFFSSPGRSNSIIDSSSPSTFSSSSSSSSSESSPAGHQPESNDLVGGGIAIPTYSPDPYNDFRRSMQEMVEARGLVDVKSNWDHLHELLTCYLSLNPKSAHKFIVGAFADLLVTLLSSPVNAGDVESDFPGGSCNVIN